MTTICGDFYEECVPPTNLTTILGLVAQAYAPPTGLSAPCGVGSDTCVPQTRLEAIADLVSRVYVQPRGLEALATLAEQIKMKQKQKRSEAKNQAVPQEEATCPSRGAKKRKRPADAFAHLMLHNPVKVCSQE
jgi:hypothetical protein